MLQTSIQAALDHLQAGDVAAALPLAAHQYLQQQQLPVEGAIIRGPPTLLLEDGGTLEPEQRVGALSSLPVKQGVPGFGASHSTPAAVQGARTSLSRSTRLVLRLDRVLADDSSMMRPPGSAVVLFEVWAEPVTQQASSVVIMQACYTNLAKHVAPRLI